jgi:hypothetical protein
MELQLQLLLEALHYLVLEYRGLLLTVTIFILIISCKTIRLSLFKAISDQILNCLPVHRPYLCLIALARFKICFRL